jgi:hypothetical protein
MSQKFSVGRSPVNDIVLGAPEVSKFHCVFWFQNDGTLWVEDLNSANGVFVNGKRIRGKKGLRLGDEVKLGKTQFFWERELLEDVSSASSAKPAAAAAGHRAPETRGGVAQIPATPARNQGWLVALVSILLLLGVLWSTGMLEDFRAGFSEVTGQWAKKNDPIVYETSCLTENNTSNEIIQVVGQVKRDVLDLDHIEVTLEEEIELGRQVKAQMDEEYTYSEDSKYTTRVSKIFNKLKNALDAPRFDYECHVVESADVNAHTAGGQVFIFTGILDFAQSDDEIACILGHEIFHNELGHLTDYMREERLGQEWFGEHGQYYMLASQLVSRAFNQENEVYSDMHGLDLAVEAGYDGCAGIALWERMAAENNPGRRTLWQKFTSTHPFSEERAHCNRAHIEQNYHHVCH